MVDADTVRDLESLAAKLLGEAPEESGERLTDIPLESGEYPAVELPYARPRVRLDCLPGGCNEARPCPFVSCRHHLFLNVNRDSGEISYNFGVLEPHEIQDSCALDVADENEGAGATLERVGGIFDCSREFVRQWSETAFKKARASALRMDLGDMHFEEVGEPHAFPEDADCHQSFVEFGKMLTEAMRRRGIPVGSPTGVARTSAEAARKKRETREGEDS